MQTVSSDIFWPVLSCVALLACEGSDGPPTAASSRPAAVTSSAAASATALPTAVPTASALTVASAAPSASAAAAPEPPPTSDEWESAKEIVVIGSTALGCETKRVRDWVRVLCAKPNDTGGTPTSVKLKKAEVLRGMQVVRSEWKNVKTSSEEGETMLMARYVMGIDVEAQFSWTDQEKRLVLWWPMDKPEPLQLGGFK